MIVTLDELLIQVRDRGVAHPLDAVEIASSPELGVCAANCGQPCGMLISIGAGPQVQVHMKCFLDRCTPPAAPPAVTPDHTHRVAAPATSTTPLTARAARRSQTRSDVAAEPKSELRLAAVVDQHGLWLTDQAAPLPIDPPASMAELYRLGIAHQVRQVWVHPSAHEVLGLPKRDLLKVGPAEVVEHPFVNDARGVRCDPAGLTAWCNIAPAAGSTIGGGRRVAVALPGYESRAAWRRASDGRALLAAVTAFDAALKENYYLSPNETGLGLLRSSATSDPAALGAPDMPEPTGQLAHSHLWSRHLLEEEDDAEAWLHRWDLNGAQPSVFGSIFVATAPYQHHTSTEGPIEFDPTRHKNIAGYWLLDIPRDRHGLDPRLPDLLKPLREADARTKTTGQPGWFVPDSVVLLAELGVPFTVVQAWLADTSARVLRPMADRYRAARTTLLTQRGAGMPGGGLAYEVLKSVFTSRIGDFNRDGARVFRPDYRDAILARAAANQYRALRGVALGRPATKTRPATEGSGRFPLGIYEDAVYYVSLHPDPEPAAAEIGLPIGPELGRYSHEASLPLSIVREHVGTRGFHRGVTRALRGVANTSRPAGEHD